MSSVERDIMRTWSVLILFILAAGCRNDMYDQPRYKPLAAGSNLIGPSSARKLIPGTVAREESRTLDTFDTGMKGESLADEIPFPVDRAVLERGRERYAIFCTPCHGGLGDGQGMIVKRGFSPPPSFHTEESRKAPVGHFFDVITNGHGAMYSYASRVPTRDRWAITAYIRALQLSQHAEPNDLDAMDRARLSEAKP
jgi:mono/diheme cytochrome c family protein